MRHRVVPVLDRAALFGLAAWPFVYSWAPGLLGPAGTTAWRVLLAATAVAAIVRHILRPSPTLLAPVVQRARALVRAGGGRDVLLAFLASRSVVLIVAAVVTVSVVPAVDLRLPGPPLWSMQARWDAFWYLNIARHGYSWDPADPTQQNVAFFPVLPILMRTAGDLVTIPAYLAQEPNLFGTSGDTRVLLGGSLVTLVAFAAGLMTVYRLARHHLPDDGARWAAVLTACHPYGVFFSAVYTESLFLLGSASVVLSLRRGRLATAAGWGLLLGLTRPNAFVLCGAFAVLVFELAASGSLPRSRLPAALATCLAPIAGLSLHMSYLWARFDDPLLWARAQAAWGRSFDPLAWLTRRVDAIAGQGLVPAVGGDPYAAANFAMCLIGLGLVWWVRRVSWAYVAIGLLAVAPALLIDLPALGRMTAPLFPVGLGLAIALPKTWRLPVAIAALLMQILGAGLFYAWRPFT